MKDLKKYLICLVFSVSALTLGCSGCGVSPSTKAAPNVTPAGPKTVIFIGDSITYLWDAQPEFTAHTSWTNKGTGGQTSTQIAMRFQHDVIDAMPDEVHILMGTNDTYPDWTLCSNLASNATPTAPPTAAALTLPADTCSNMIYVVETAKRNNIKVVIGTIPPWGCEDDPTGDTASLDTTPGRYLRIDSLNDWIKELGVKENVAVVDYHTALAAPDGMYYVESLQFDCVHPNSAGYAVITPLVEAQLE